MYVCMYVGCFALSFPWHLCIMASLPAGRELLQLGYFTEEHYASVRPLSESTAPLVSGEKDLGDASRPKDPNLPQTLSEQIVVESTNCRDFVKIRKLLQENWDNADTVVQILWDEQIGGGLWCFVQYIEVDS